MYKKKGIKCLKKVGKNDSLNVNKLENEEVDMMESLFNLVTYVTS